MATSPTQRTLKYYRDLKWTCQVVEKWVPMAKKRVDLFNCIDIVAMKKGAGIIGIQATSGTNHAQRRTKAMAEPKLREWLESGGRFWVVSWSKRGGAGKRKLWTIRQEEITLEDLDGQEASPNPVSPA
tara:strand:- start:34 stop:417 length:384 start_codon:yes stop_codon:yes gene_type:complete